MMEKRVQLEEGDISWFYETYGPNASLGWVMGMLLAEFRKAHEKSPSDYGAIGAAELKRMLGER